MLGHQFEDARNRQHLSALKRLPGEILIAVPISGPCGGAIGKRKQESEAKREDESLLHRASIARPG